MTPPTIVSLDTTDTSAGPWTRYGVSSVRNRGPITSIRLTVVDAADNQAQRETSSF